MPKNRRHEREGKGKEKEKREQKVSAIRGRPLAFWLLSFVFLIFGERPVSTVNGPANHYTPIIMSRHELSQTLWSEWSLAQSCISES